MIAQPSEFYEIVKNNVETSLRQVTKTIMDQTVYQAIGVERDHWGDITRIDPKLLDRVQSSIDSSIREDFENSLIRNVQEKLKKGPTQDAVKETYDRVVYKIEQELESRVVDVCDRISDELIPIIEKQIRDEHFKVWGVAAQLKEANKNAKENSKM